jgi:hypothetical protein
MLSISDILNSCKTKGQYQHLGYIYDPKEAFQPIAFEGYKVVSYYYKYEFNLSNNKKSYNFINPNNFGKNMINQEVNCNEFVLNIFPTLCDMIEDVSSDQSFSIVLGDDMEEYNKDTSIITCLGEFTNKAIVINLDKLNYPDKFYVLMKCYLFGTTLRKEFKMKGLYNDTHEYSRGLIFNKISNPIINKSASTNDLNHIFDYYLS